MNERLNDFTCDLTPRSGRARWAAAAALGFAVTLGCGSDDAGSNSAAASESDDGPAPAATDDGPDPTDDGPDPTDDGPTELPTQPTMADESLPLVGTFLVSLVPPVASTGTPGFTSVQGSVFDGPQNELTIWEFASSDSNGCELLTPRTPTCATACGSTAACVEDDTCNPHPQSQNLGVITITGLKTMDGINEFAMNPQMPKLNYNKPVSVNVLFPPTDEGDIVLLASAGGDVGPIQIAATGISSLEVLGPEEIPIARETAMDLEWVPAAAGSSRIDVKVDISHHGGAKGKIVCQVDDTGSLSISADLVTGLIDLGFSGFPTVALTRQGVGSAAVGEGKVELRLESGVERPLEVPGLTSCIVDEDCPEEGHVCRNDRSCGAPA
jgi:hypothetical protein